MTHWVKKLGIAATLALALGASLPGEASAHDSHRAWRQRSYDRFRYSGPYGTYERHRPAWSYSPYYRSDYWRDRYGRDHDWWSDRYYRPPGHRHGWYRNRWYDDRIDNRYGSNHRHGRHCHH